ncbi:MAG: class I SAM-dependent methyltransferase [Candidatus Polarisedimenticolia bacterium]|nr:class I SAM-dependent methyltransferase [bacterium]
MVDGDRWQAAQEYERGYWERAAQRISEGAASQLDWYRWRADRLAARLSRLGMGELAQGGAAVVEVGSGPVGLAGFFPAAKRVLIDPLNEFYGRNPVLTKLRNPEAVYLAGPGESLPIDDGAFDLAIIENCIDHVRDCDAVMRELRRALKPDGVLYLTVNCRSRLGYPVHRVLSRLRLDRGHPHTFVPRKLERLLRAHRFDVQEVDPESYWTSFWADLWSPRGRDRLKALLGISEYIASAVAIRRDA